MTRKSFNFGDGNILCRVRKYGGLIAPTAQVDKGVELLRRSAVGGNAIVKGVGSLNNAVVKGLACISGRGFNIWDSTISGGEISGNAHLGFVEMEGGTVVGLEVLITGNGKGSVII